MRGIPIHLFALFTRTALAGGVIAASVYAFQHIRLPVPPTETAPARQADHARYVYVSFSSDLDTLYLASTDPAQKPVEIADVPHAREWGIRAAVSPDGRWVAYTAMPPGARRSETEAEAWAVRIDGGDHKRLATGVDLLARPVWKRDSRGFVVRRYERDMEGLPPLRLELALLTGNDRLLVRRQTVGLYPVGFTEGDARFWFAEITPGGTDMRSIARGRERLEAHISDGIARDWTISAGGTDLAYLAPVLEGGGVAYRAFRVGIDGRSRDAVPVRSAAGEHVGTAWRPGSAELAIGGPAMGAVPRLIDPAGALGRDAAPAAGSGFEQPLAWSPDGRFLALRAFTGRSVEAPGTASDQLVLPSGDRLGLPDGPNAFVDWVPG